MNNYKFLPKCLFSCLMVLSVLSGSAQAERIKDLVSIQGIRSNQVVGYGLVVGLDGTGDQTMQTPFTVQSINNMLGQMGVNLPPGGPVLQLRNIAAVMITATMPPFGRPGQTIDVTVSSMGNARSLRGGTLLMTPLKGADGQVYAMAQGHLLVGGVGAASGGSSAVVNHMLAGRIAAGATIERMVETPFGQGDYIDLELGISDFTTVRRIVNVINRNFAKDTASALDGRVIRVRAPADLDERVTFLSQIEVLDVSPAQTTAKVIINARTGSVVMNQLVTLENTAVAHGNLSVIISSEPVISQPGAFSPQGQTVQAQKSQVEIRSDDGELVMLRNSASLGEVVKALNSIGATPQDLLSILQAMKAAGSLRADLEII
jgi:flagellar P-ring protein precursor FlgI